MGKLFFVSPRPADFHQATPQPALPRMLRPVHPWHLYHFTLKRNCQQGNDCCCIFNSFQSRKKITFQFFNSFTLSGQQVFTSFRNSFKLNKILGCVNRECTKEVVIIDVWYYPRGWNHPPPWDLSNYTYGIILSKDLFFSWLPTPTALNDQNYWTSSQLEQQTCLYKDNNMLRFYFISQKTNLKVRKKKCTNATLLSIHPPFSHQLSGNPLKYYFFPEPLKKFFKTFSKVSSDIVRIWQNSSKELMYLIRWFYK